MNQNWTDSESLGKRLAVPTLVHLLCKMGLCYYENHEAGRTNILWKSRGLQSVRSNGAASRNTRSQSTAAVL